MKVHPAPDLTGFTRNRSNRVRVIMTLHDPPLAAATYARGFGGLGSRSKLNMHSAFSRSYLGTLEAAQARAITELRAEIPQAVVSRRYQVLVNGFAVSVPYSRLPDLLDTRIATHVYPSLTYTLDLNRGPSVLGAPAFSAATGTRGDGVKVAVVDDGVDQEHPFLDPKGFSFPPGFPKGATGSTTPKVIVARGFAGPGANSAPLDRDNSFHGTFVAGVIAGVKTDVEAGQTGFCIESAGGCHPAVKDVEGVAPRAYIGNYRVFNVPAPSPLGGCCSANSPEIVAAFEAAVKDGMDIINFSGGGPQADPRTDILIEAVSNVMRAGVVPIISAGNDRDFFGLGTAGSPATAPDAISVGAVANAHVFGASLSVVSPSGLPLMPFAPTDTIPPSWISANQRLVDVGSIAGVSRQLCDAAPAASLGGAIALVSRGGCPYSVKAARARDAGAIGIVIAENRPGDPTFAYITALAAGEISDLDGARIRAAAAGSGGAVTVRFNRDTLEVPTTWAGVPTSFTSSGLTPFGHALKPDVTAPGAQVLSSTLPEFAGDQFAVLDGTSFSAPHISGVAALLTQRHPSWTPQQMKSALMSTAGPAWGDTSLTQEASVLVEGAGLVRVGTADRPLIFSDPQSLSFGYLVAGGGANAKSISVGISDAGDGAGTWVAEVRPQVASAGATVEAAPVTLAPGGTAVMQITARAAGGAVQGDDFGFILLRRGSDVRRIPYAFSVSRSSLTGASVAALKTLQSGDTRAGDDRASVYRWPTSPFSILGIFGVDPSVNDDGKEKIYSLDIKKQAVNAGVVVVRPETKLDASFTALLQLEPADSSVVHGLSRRERRARLRGNPGERERLAARLPLLGRRCRRRVPAARSVLRLRRLRARPLHRSLARRSLHPALVGQRRQAADGQGHHEAALERAADDRRQGHRRKIGSRPARAPALLRAGQAPILGRGVDVRSGDGNRSVLHSPQRAPTRSRDAVHAARRLGLPGREEHQHRVRQPASEYALRGAPSRGCAATDDHLGHAREGQVPGGAPEAARRGERQRSDLVGRVLRRPAPGRARSEERRRSLRDDVAHDRQAQGPARTHGHRVGRARARGRSDSAVRICK